MYVKMMGHTPPVIIPDASLPPATFRVWQCVADVNLIHEHEDNVLIPDRFKMELTFEDHIRLTVDVLGPVYILNDQGKTIEKFECPPRTPHIPFAGPPHVRTLVPRTVRERQIEHDAFFAGNTQPPAPPCDGQTGSA